MSPKAKLRRPDGGYSLVELLVAIAMVGILIGVAVPSYRNATLNSRLASLSNSLVASARLARAEAFKRNLAVTLCASTNATTCSGDTGWQTGWVVLASDGTVLATQGAAPTGFRITGSGATFSFNPRGFGTGSGTFTICRYSPSAGSSERVVTLDPTGRTWLQKTSNGSCS